MSVHFGVSHSIDAGVKTLSPRPSWQSLLAWFRPHCPDCGGTMAFRYTMPEEYREISPKYFECSCCRAHYMRVGSGPWVAVPSECDWVYQQKSA